MLRHAVVRLLAAPLFTAFSVVWLAAGAAVPTAARNTALPGHRIPE